MVGDVGVWITQVVAWAQEPRSWYGVCLNVRARVPDIMWARLQPASNYDVIITSLDHCMWPDISIKPPIGQTYGVI